jgi:flavin-dependent dehydrogenase
VVVVGGGPTGAAAAAALHLDGLEVELVASAPRSRQPPGESLPPGTETELDALFGPRGFRPDQHRPAYANRSVWGGAGVDTAEFIDNPFGHGWHIDRAAMDASLLDAVREQGVAVRTGTRVALPAWKRDHWSVGLEHGGAEIRARAIVDATGRAATIARAQGARRRRLDRLVAVHWLLSGTAANDHDATTLVEAVASGWWYSTPVPRGRVLAYMTDADLLPGREARAISDWRRRIAQAPAIRQGLASNGCALSGSARIVDASVAYLDHLSGPGWLAAGDAAVSFDPLSSQGILTALVMGRRAGRALAAILTHGDPQPLARYGADYASLLDAHLRLRAAYYGLEQRWPEAPFWTRRHVSAQAN